MVDLKTAEAKKEFFSSKTFPLLPGCVKWSHLENEGTMSQETPPHYANTKETSKFTLDIEEGGFGSFGMDDAAVKLHEELQKQQFDRLVSIGEEMSLKAWENAEVMVRTKEEMVKIFIDDNDDVKSMKKSEKPKACDPKALTNHPKLRKQWLRMCMTRFPVTGETPNTLKMKRAAYKTLWKNNQNTGELVYNPPVVTNAIGAQLNTPDHLATISDDQKKRHVMKGDLVQAYVQMKMWVNPGNNGCGIKLDLIRVKKLADGPGESKGQGKDIDMSMYAHLAKRQKTEPAQA